MNQIYPDQGLLSFLDLITANTFKLRLFTTNVTPDRDTLLGALTAATWTGYATASVLTSDWAITSVSGHVGTVIAPPVVFLNTSGMSQSAYGYAITDASETVVLAAARFDGAPVTIADGGTLSVLPILGDSSRLSS